MRQNTPTKCSAPWPGVIISLALAACATNEPQTDVEEIGQRFGALHAAYVANDVAAILSFYEEDAVRLPAKRTIVRGRAEIREGMVRSREQTDVIFDDIGEPVIQQSGDLAVTYSTYAERRVSKATGDVTRQSGQWLLVWRRQADGIWRVSTETWTVEVPQQG